MARPTPLNGQHRSRRMFLAGSGAVLATPLIGGAAAVASVSGHAFGTHWRLSGPAGARLEALIAPLTALFARIDAQMSPWRPDSVLSRFNAAGSGAMTLPEQTATVTGAALRIAQASGGTFDPTVGPLVARWGFGPIHGTAGRGAADIRLDGRRLTKAHPGTTLDLCGIAKGHALDAATDLARRHGLADLLFDLGGELRALGRHPDGRDWQVAVDGPAPRRVLRLPPGRAVATSGQYAQGYALGTERYGHIIDPEAGRPADGALRSVTVAAETAMRADGWATALFAAGATGGPALARRMGLDALFRFETGHAPATQTTGAFAALLVRGPA